MGGTTSQPRLVLGLVMMAIGLLGLWQVWASLAEGVASYSSHTEGDLSVGLYRLAFSVGPGVLLSALWVSGWRWGGAPRWSWRLLPAGALAAVGLVLLYWELEFLAFFLSSGPSGEPRLSRSELLYIFGPFGSALLVGGLWVLNGSELRRAREP